MPFTAVFAQDDAPSEKNTKSDDVIELSAFTVTSDEDVGYFSKNTLVGTRTNERLVNIPQNIQIVNEEFLEDLGSDNGIDSFKYAVSGINKREATSGDTFIRGFRVGGNAFLRNGVKFRGNMNIPLYDVERVEVIKGPAALLFGLQAPSGGVVNYVSKGASDKPEQYVKASLGSFSLKRLEAASAGPLGDSDFSYRVTAAATDSDARRKFDYFEDKFISMAVDYKISDTTKASFYYNYYYLDQVVSTETSSRNGTFLDIARDFSQQEEWVNMPRHVQYLSLQLTTEFTPTLQGRFLVNGSNQDFDFDQIFANEVPDANGDMNRRFQNYQGKERGGNSEWDIVKTFDLDRSTHKITWGSSINYQRTKTHYDGVQITPINVYNPVYGTVSSRPAFVNGTATPGGYTNNSAQRKTEGSMYLQGQSNFMDDRLILIAGISWQGTNTYRFNNLSGSVRSQIDRAFLNRYGAVFKPVDAFSLYYNYSESVSFWNSTFEGGPRDGEILDPSYTTNNEFGVKAETPGGLLFGSLAVFDLNRTNVRFRFTQPNGDRGTDQRASESNQGWETDIGIGLDNPMGRAQLILTYYDGGTVGSNGQIPRGVTNKMWSAFATQKVSEGSLAGLKFGAGLYHKGSLSMGSASID